MVINIVSTVRVLPAMNYAIVVSNSISITQSLVQCLSKWATGGPECLVSRTSVTIPLRADLPLACAILTCSRLLRPTVLLNMSTLVVILSGIDLLATDVALRSVRLDNMWLLVGI